MVKIIVMLAVAIFCLLSSAKGAYFTPIAYTLPGGLSSVDGSSSTGGCQPESCVMMPISGTAINGCDCPGTTPVNGTLIDGVIPSIDTTQRGTWARELFTVNGNGQDSIMIGFQFRADLEFDLRGIEIMLFHCPVQGIGVTGINVYTSDVFPAFFSTASSLLVIHNSPPSDSCHSLSTISIPIRPPMAASEFYFFEFSSTGGSSVYQLNWLHLGEIRFSDVEIPFTFTTTATPTTTKSITSSTISSEHQTTASDGRIFTIYVIDESASGSGSLEPDDYNTLSNSMNVTTSSERLTTTLGSAGIDASSVPITSIVGGLVGIIAVLLLLLIVGAIIIACLIIHHRQNLYKLKPGSSLEHHYAVIENPNNGTAPSLELQNLSIPGGEERRPSTAINDLYEPTTDLETSNSNILSASDPGGDVIYSEIRDTPGMHDSGTQEMAQDTISIDLYDDDDDDSIQENHYAIIPEMYMLATPINQVKLSVRPKSIDESLTVASHSNSCAGELKAQENEKSYSLVHKQPDECPPPVPEKSIELQQYLTVTVKVTAGTEVQDQQQDGGEQSDENLDQTECPQ